MDIGSKEFNGKLIFWIVLIGAIIIFHDIINDSIDGYNTAVDYYNYFIEEIWHR